ncbi:unnamed protein product [Calypogeia fissa]
MAIRGVWQLKKLVFYLCDYSGSSRGAREFVDVALPKFKSDNPQLEVVTEILRGHHPYLKGYYANKNERVVDVKNKNVDEILHQATHLRNSTGRKVVKLSTRHVTFRPSVQGTWTPDIKF